MADVIVTVRTPDACVCRPAPLSRSAGGVVLLGEVALAALAIALIVVGYAAKLLGQPLLNLGHHLEDRSRLLRSEE